MKNIADKSHFSEELVLLQKNKGTYDSPCMSVCNYDEQAICQTCSMKKEEKTQWKTGQKAIKDIILSNVLKRRKFDNLA